MCDNIYNYQLLQGALGRAYLPQWCMLFSGTSPLHRVIHWIVFVSHQHVQASRVWYYFVSSVVHPMQILCGNGLRCWQTFFSIWCGRHIVCSMRCYAWAWSLLSVGVHLSAHQSACLSVCLLFRYTSFHLLNQCVNVLLGTFYQIHSHVNIMSI